MDITRALAIEGWMSEPELSWLADQATRHTRIVEIGSFLGRSTRALCDHTPGTVIAIDDWYGPRDVSFGEEVRKKFFDAFVANMAGCEGKLEILIEDHGSIEALRGTPDMVFIDGDHTYANVCRDITFWREKLLPGGLLCGHDINFEEVAEACTLLLPDADVAADTSIWYWTKPS